MSTPRNHLSELTPEFWTSRMQPKSEDKDDGPLRDKYTMALEMLYQPDTTASSIPAATTAFAPAATTLPKKFSIVSPQFTFLVDHGFDSLSTSGDPIAELAEEFWRRKQALLPKFLELPVEIREMIYEAALRNGKHFNVPLSLMPRPEPTMVLCMHPDLPGIRRFPRLVAGPRSPPLLPALCLTNKLEHRIATMVLVRGAGICLRGDGDVAAMEKFLATIGTGSVSCVASIKSVELEYGAKYRKDLRWDKMFDPDFTFLSKFSKLRDVTITIPGLHFGDVAEREGRVQLLQEDFGTNFDPDRFRACATLQRFAFITPPNWLHACPVTWPASRVVAYLKTFTLCMAHNTLPGPKEDVFVKLVYISGLEVPFLTPDGVFVEDSRIFPGSVKGIALERAPKNWGISVGDRA